MNCPFCLKSNENGLSVCAHCGKPLPTAVRTHFSAASKYVTQELRSRGTGSLSLPPSEDYLPQDTGFLHDSAILTLELIDSNSKIYLKTQGHISLGRADKESNWQPTVDLTPYGATELGVSRAHADLLFENDQVFVLELGSANGTRINGILVKTGEAQRLRNGDMLQLGSLKITVSFG